MEVITSQGKRLDDSLSKREVTFCDKSSVPYYTAEDKVDSLNDSVTHVINNDDVPLSPEIFAVAKNSFDSKNMSQNYLNNLPEAVVILEKVPEALLHKHGYSNEDGKGYQMPTVAQCTDETGSINSNLSHLKKITKPVVNKKKSKVLKKHKYPLQNIKVIIPHLLNEIENKSYENDNASSKAISSTENFGNEISNLNRIVNNLKSKSNKNSENLNTKYSVFTDHNSAVIQEQHFQNSFFKLPPTKIINLKNVDKSSNKKKENLKLVDSDVRGDIINKENYNEVSFDKYPCIHLEKLDLKSILQNISNTSSRKNVVKDLELEVRNATNESCFPACEKNEQLIKESVSKTVNLALNEKNIDLVSNQSDFISPEDIYSQNSILRKLLTGNLSKVSVDANKYLENNTSDASLLQNKNIGRKETNCENSSFFKISQNEFPRVLLEKLDLLSYFESLSNTSNRKDAVKDSKMEVKNVASESCDTCEKSEQLNEESVSKTVDLSLTERDIELVTDNSEPISSKNIYSPNSILKKLLTSNLSKVSIGANKYLNNSSDASLIQNENIGRKETNYKDSNCFKNAQNEFPHVLLEKFNSSATEIYTNLGRNASQPLCLNLAPDDVSDLPLQIRSSISKRRKKKKYIEKQKKKLARKIFSSRSTFSTFDHSSSEDEEDDIPLLILLKKKLLNAHVVYDSSDSLSDDNVAYRSLAKTNANLTVKTYSKKNKRENCSKKNKNKNYSKEIKNKNCSKETKNKKCNKSVGTSKLRKKNTKKLLMKKQLKAYNTFIKYLRMHINSKKHKKKYNKRKNHHKNSANLKSGQLISQNNRNESDRNDLMIYNSTKYKNNSVQIINSQKPNETSIQRKSAVIYGESSTFSAEKSDKAKKRKKSLDKYRLGFLSNEFSLRFYNRFFASERLLFSKCNMKKNKKKEFKRLFKKVKAVSHINVRK